MGSMPKAVHLSRTQHFTGLICSPSHIPVKESESQWNGTKWIAGWGLWAPILVWSLSLYPCRVQNTLSRDTIKLGSYWSLPKPDTRLTEHVNNFEMSILIVHVFEKAHSCHSAAERIWSSNFWTVKHGVSSQLSCFPPKNPTELFEYSNYISQETSLI